MSLLELEDVHKAYGRSSSRRVVLERVSLHIAPGELVAIWGLRRSGRSTLLRVAAGLERPDSGTVRFDGHAMNGRDSDGLRAQIGYCRRSFGPSDGRAVLDQLMLSQLARGANPGHAIVRVRSALSRVHASACAGLKPSELSGEEAVRVILARALASRPRLLVIDEPTLGIDPIERDQILALLRSLADDGMAVLTSTDRTAGLAGADQALSLSEGELRGSAEPELAAVLPLRRAGGRAQGA